MPLQSQPEKTIDYDVVIIGAGPAGCACALALQNTGLSVALIDKAIFPRDKICGDAIPGPSFKAIESLNPKWAILLKQFTEKNIIDSSSVSFSSNRTFEHKWETFAYNSKRIDFDNRLFSLVKEETDTSIFENNQVIAVIKNKHSITCDLKNGTRINGSIIVGCDGAKSVVKKLILKKTNPQKTVYAAVRAYYKGISGCKDSRNEFYYLKAIDGYFWIFPLSKDIFNIGFGVINKKKFKKSGKIDLREKLEGIVNSDIFKERFSNAELISNMNGHLLPIWTEKKVIAGERFLLAGDAASLIDPLQGHGIDKAIWSGIFAANQVKTCFDINRFDAQITRNYEKLINKKFGMGFRRNYLIMKIFTEYPFLVKVISLLKPNIRISNFLIKKLKL